MKQDKKIIKLRSLSLVTIVMFCLMLPFSVINTRYPYNMAQDNEYVESVLEETEYIEKLIIEEESIVEIDEVEPDPIEIAIQEMQGKMYDIGVIEDKEQWFIAYKGIFEEYKDILDPPLTIYDYFTDEEIYLIQCAVETECYDQSFNGKVNVASVVFNRLEKGGEFGSTVKEVITNDNQFAYWRKDITESTILAVEYAYQIEDTTDGCIAFRSDDKPEVWYGWIYAFTDDTGHNFYKLKEK